jgi:hypothetical protein
MIAPLVCLASIICCVCKNHAYVRCEIIFSLIQVLVMTSRCFLFGFFLYL